MSGFTLKALLFDEIKIIYILIYRHKSKIYIDNDMIAISKPFTYTRHLTDLG